MITNVNNLNDGFGESFKFIIYSVLYAEFTNSEFFYSPFTKCLEHNYENDPEFLEKKEILINFKNSFKLASDYSFDYNIIDKFKLISFFENNIDFCINSKSFQKLKKIFRENNNPSERENKDKKNIVIHIRRMNSLDQKKNKNYDIIPGTDVPNELYIDIIKQLKNIYQKSEVHLYSQGKKEDFNLGDNIIFHLNEPIEKTFIDFVYADVLIVAPSALSYVAALLSDGIIYYIKHMHKPAPHWNIINNYVSTRDRYQFFIRNKQNELIKIYYDAEKEKFYFEDEISGKYTYIKSIYDYL